MQSTRHKKLRCNNLRRVYKKRAERTGLSECVPAAFRRLQQRHAVQQLKSTCNRFTSYAKLQVLQATALQKRYKLFVTLEPDARRPHGEHRAAELLTFVCRLILLFWRQRRDGHRACVRACQLILRTRDNRMPEAW